MLPATILNWVISDPARAKQLSRECITEYDLETFGKDYDYFVNEYGASPCEKPDIGYYIVVKTPTMSENIVIGMETSDFDIDNGEYKYQFFKLINIV